MEQLPIATIVLTAMGIAKQTDGTAKSTNEKQEIPQNTAIFYIVTLANSNANEKNDFQDFSRNSYSVYEALHKNSL